MKKIILALFLILAGPSNAAFLQAAVGGPNTGLCPQGTALPDGCPAAPVGGSFQNISFFTTARQSGQSSYAARPAWNVAGVDYPVGYPAATVLRDPTSCSCLPAGSSYASNVITVTGANVTLDAFDLSVASGITLVVTAAASGTFTLSNSKVVMGSATNVKPQWLVIGTAGSSTGPNVVLSNNDIDGQATAGGGPAGAGSQYNILNWGRGTFTATYNKFYNFNRRMALSAGASSFKYNYFEGQNYNTPDHGEWVIYNAMDTAGLTNASIAWSYNTFLNPVTFGAGQTSPIYASSGALAQSLTITAMQIDHNVSVQNSYYATGYIVTTALHITADTSGQIGIGGNSTLDTTSGVSGGTHITSGGPGGIGVYTINNSQTVGSVGTPVNIGFPVISIGLVEVGYDTISTSLNVTSNYMDDTGVLTNSMFANSPAVGGSPTFTGTGNINMLTGGTITPAFP